MIPLKLEFQAFGSYVERQTVDFSRLENGDIFLINGKTGSGKTTIIDAMVFALYSKGSGADRNTLADMRSKSFGALDIPTETSFTFEVKGKTYKFERRCFVRTKNKRDGSTEQVVETEQNAFELTNDGFTPLFDNPKGKDLDTLAEQLIGLNHEQFTKVMVLPQGKFESFLVANSIEKEQILSTLFNVEKWHKIADWICKNANSIKNEADKRKNNCDETLKRYNCAEREELTALSEASGERLLQLEKELLENEALTKKLIEEKEKLLLVSDSFLQLESLEKDFSQLENQKGIYENLKQEISKNKTALEIEPYYDFCIEYGKQLKARNGFCAEITVKLSEAEAVAESLLKKLDGINALQSETDSDKIRLQKLCDNRENLTALTAEKQLLSQLEKKLCEDNSEINRLSAHLDKVKASISEAEKERKLLSSQLSQLTKLSENKKQIDESAKLEKEISTFSQQISTNNDEISTLDEKIRQKQDVLVDVQKNREERYNHYIINLASTISQSLTEGEACPVCGSIHHPSPAQAPENVATKGEIRTLDTQIEKLRNELSQLENSKSLAISKNNQLQSELSEKKNKLCEIPSFTDDEKQRILSDFELSMTAGEKLEEISAKLEKLGDENLRVSQSLENLKNSTFEAEKQKATSLAKTEAISSELDKLGILNVSDNSQLEMTIKELSEKIYRYNVEKADSEKAYSNASAQVITLTESKKTAFDEVEKAEKLLKKAQDDYAEIMKNKGFSGRDEYNSYHISREEIDKKEKSLQEFNNRYNSTKTLILQLREKLKDTQRPDVEGISLQITQAETCKKELLSEKSSLTTSFETLGKDISYYDENYKNYSKLSSESERLWRFGRDIRGDNGVGLRRHVLGVMLDRIIHEANIILREVKGGQFSLYVNRDREGSKRQFGLEIFVLNTHAEQPYSVRSLSGGEKFLVAMALSMALSSIVQMYAGGIRIDALFIDEGFGTLDNDVLNDALRVLTSVGQSRKVLGIISHVDILKDAIAKKINVTSTPQGSRLSVDF